MGKHERPSEKGILDRACEVAELIRGLEIDGVVGIYPYSGIALTAPGAGVLLLHLGGQQWITTFRR